MLDKRNVAPPTGPLETLLREMLLGTDFDAELRALTDAAGAQSQLRGRADYEGPQSREPMGWPFNLCAGGSRSDGEQDPADPHSVEQECHDRAADVGLDTHAVRTVAEGLTALGLPEHAAEHALAIAVGLCTPHRGAEVGKSVRDRRLLDGVEATMVLSRFTDAAMLGMVRDLAMAAGQKLLAHQGVAGVEELSMTGRRRWRARTKSAVATELQALTGWGIQSCHDRVGVALAPGGVAQRAEWALSHGWVDLRAVLDFWRRARNLPSEQAAAVAQQILGPVPDGDGVPVRASREQFTGRLHRAVTAAEGSDAAAARARRQTALDARDATAVVDDDGTATFTVSGGTAAVAAAMLRVDSVARRARHHGDERTIAQLRADLALALLVHGTLPDEEVEQPADVAAQEGAADGKSPTPQEPTAWSDEETSGAAASDESLTKEPPGSAALVAEPGPKVRSALSSAAGTIGLEVIVPLNALIDPDSAAVAEIVGFGPITAEHACELAQAEGTTIHRLLTDPADGRCIERSIGSYRPDQAMLDQLRASDRTCRGPGCTRDVRHAQPDHVQPWQESRWTAEPNVAYEHSHHHNNLTLKLWTAQLRADRTMTFTTLFGRVYSTRAYDYRDLHPLDSPTSPLPLNTGPPETRAPGVAARGASPPETGPSDTERPGIDPDLADRLIYAALADRGPHDHLADDLDERAICDQAALPTRAQLRAGSDHGPPLFDLRHHTPGGAIRPGPPPGQPSVHDILHPTPPEPPSPPPPGPAPPF